jgi:flavorubredoxin
VEDAFRYDRLVLASITYNGDVFPYMKTFIHHLTERSYQNRTVGFIENGSWGPMAAKTMKSMLEGCKNLNFAETTVTVCSALNEESESRIASLADELCRQ